MSVGFSVFTRRKEALDSRHMQLPPLFIIAPIPHFMKRCVVQRMRFFGRISLGLPVYFFVAISLRVLALYPQGKKQFFPNRRIKTLCLCTIYHLKATYQLIQELTSAAIKEIDILREIALNCKSLSALCYSRYTLNSSLFTSS